MQKEELYKRYEKEINEINNILSGFASEEREIIIELSNNVFNSRYS